jgi:hypothetical protein
MTNSDKPRKPYTGKAYAFLDYGSSSKQVVRRLESNRDRFHFSNTFVFRALKDQEEVPQAIRELAERTNVYGKTGMNNLKSLPTTPKKASDLRYVILAEDSEVFDSECPDPLGQARSNQVTAGRFSTLIGTFNNRRTPGNPNAVIRDAIFYLDSRRRAERVF